MTTSETVDLKTSTGFRVSVRPVAPSDKAALADFFANVSKDDLRYRFLSAVTAVSAAEIERLIAVDHARTEDYMIFSGDTDHLIASAVISADADMETAEVAITVHSAFKNQGIEQTILEYIAKAAKGRGIKTLHAIESRENHDAIAIERKVGFTPRRVDGDPRLVLLEQRL